MHTKMDSSIIKFLRFPLIVGIVAIHAYNQDIALNPQLSTFNHIQYFFSQMLGRVSVPLFFFFSGYLFFYKKEVFDKKIYLEQIQKRFWSLFIPYIFWISLNILFISFFDNYAFSVYYKDGFTLTTFLRSYWDLISDSLPISYPLWFLRDLMILCLLTPLIYLLVKKVKLLLIFILLAWWYLDIFNYPGFRSISVLFFVSGAYLSINKYSFSALIRKIPLPILLSLCIFFVGFDLYYSNINSTINKTCILILIGVVLRLSIALLDRVEINKVLLTLSSSSFFVYLVHEPLLSYIRSYLGGIMVPIKYTIYYFSCILLTLIISVAVYLLLKKIAPRAFNFVLGNRN